MRLVAWLFRAFVFFALFAFSLNNQQTAVVHWFFGVEWHAPLVIIVLVAFTAGAVLGILAMVPSWWRHRRVARRHDAVAPAVTPAAAPMPPALAEAFPPRDGI